MIRKPKKGKAPVTNDDLDHGNLHWSACYNDTCTIHQDAKDGAGYYPSGRADRDYEENEPDPDGCPPSQYYINDCGEKVHYVHDAKMFLTKERELDFRQESPQIEDSQEKGLVPKNDTTDEEDTDESDNEESEDEVFDYVEFITDAPKPVHKILQVISVNWKYAFTKGLDDKYYLNPTHFDAMLDQIRLKFWNHRRSQAKYDASKIVRERMPLGSQFTPNGYLLPDGTFINKQMREQVSRVNRAYRAIQHVQQQLEAVIPPTHLNDSQSRAMWTATQAQKLHNRQYPWNLPEEWPLQYANACAHYGFPQDSGKD